VSFEFFELLAAGADWCRFVFFVAVLFAAGEGLE